MNQQESCILKENHHPSCSDISVNPSTVDRETVSTKMEQGEDIESFESQLERANKFIYGEPAKREIYYKMLRAVSESGRIFRFDLEDRIEDFPEKRSMFQSSGMLIDGLEKCGAFDIHIPEAEEDADSDEAANVGTNVDEEQVDRAQIAYSVSAIGSAVLEHMNPKSRLSALIEEHPEREICYRKLLDFCSSTPRTRQEIDALLKEDCEREKKRTGGLPGLYPSYYSDVLERAGCIVWDRGWIDTAEGKALLDEITR